ncbi:helix-turn-helix domain-containing protein [Yoonia sp. 208BN28-4]|uniref:helix-turn-helix domain-containing protein n=1 Tax=Yoonia sp. 208BN28-4 TaxID=3126505 RepID=UPI00309A6990
MAMQKIYAGAKLRELRGRAGLTQRAFSDRLGVSVPYLNQMENNNRPISTKVLVGLADTFDFDVSELESADEARLVSDMKEALADPVFTGPAPALADLRLAAANAPTLARAFLDLHRGYKQTHERLASLDEALGREDARPAPSPWEEVRDFFHYCDNYIDAVDRAAEQFSTRARAGQSVAQAAQTTLEDRGFTINLAHTDQLRHFDPATKTLTLSRDAATATRTFQLLLQLALSTQDDLLEATLDLARFQSDAARSIAKVGLANYFAGAALMPYTAFLQATQDTRHDLELLSARFGASLEQVAHRLSTLQRTGAKGIPFFFVRVDQAGTITKRHSATTLQFARYGGACPLWNVHRAFETPGQFLRQLAQTPDGVRYFCLARDVSKTGGSYHAPTRRYAIGLGCEVQHAGALVYADHMNIDTDAAYEPIGISCRICERPNCHQRAVPPLERNLKVDPNRRDMLPYQVI